MFEERKHRWVAEESPLTVIKRDHCNVAILESDHLHLRPRSIQDLELYPAMDRDPEVARFVAGPWDDPIQHERFVRERISRNYGDGLGTGLSSPKTIPADF
ncbi:hypothetical protein ASD00_32060 [Ensifer sp. Root31]|nr:hypothetical protein ASD00_32060 [Ensifer sp. Root31]